MRYLVLATDYDGTLAHDGVVSPETVNALERFSHSGRMLILVTGRELPELEAIFPRLDLFRAVVAENGALLYHPATREKRALAQRPPEEFIQDLRSRGVTNLSAGEVIVATWHPYEEQVIKAIRDSGLELHVIFNKDAVMILPSGVNKMTGLAAALAELKISRHNVVAIGDAENDHTFLDSCECAVAVSNAIPALKHRADIVTQADHGSGVVEIIGKVLEEDLASLPLARHNLLLGRTRNEIVSLSPYGSAILVCGQSGSGKSTLVAGFVEQLMEREYQVCLIDPEGDYQTIPNFKTTGDSRHAPSLDHLAKMLEDPKIHAAANLVGVSMRDRAGVCASILGMIQDRRLHTGRPHWVVVDEAHHVLPSEWSLTPGESHIANLLMISVHPGHVARAALQTVKTVIAVGADQNRVLNEFAEAIHVPPPDFIAERLAPGEATVWFRDRNRVAQGVRTVPPQAERDRHKRKYAEGQLEEARVFYFRGPEDRLHLRVQNLSIFVQIAEGIDDETWLFHLQRGHYSDWLRNGVKDEPLAEAVRNVEQNAAISPAESRMRIKHFIEEKYTAPA